jgi:hypothetical protein
VYVITIEINGHISEEQITLVDFDCPVYEPYFILLLNLLTVGVLGEGYSRHAIIYLRFYYVILPIWFIHMLLALHILILYY